MKTIEIKRIYEAPSQADGIRILVDRLWPRGIKKNDLHMNAWIKELAPNTDLRTWFNHDPKKFKEFEKKYIKDLDDTKDIWLPLIKKYLTDKITLLYAAHDPEINHAICLKHYLEKLSSTR